MNLIKQNPPQRGGVLVPLAGTRYGTLYQILNSLLLMSAATHYDADLRQLLMLSRTENLATAALLFVDRDTDKEHYDQGYRLMFGAADLDATHSRFSMSPVQVDGAGGWPMR